MNKAYKQKWVKALLSGKYKQGEGCLKKDGRFCCLGVLRDCVDPQDDRVSYIDIPNAFLSGAQLREYGLTHTIQLELSIVNDSGVPFEMIAGLIDQTL